MNRELSADGFGTFSGRDRPYLVTEALRAVRRLDELRVTVHPSEVAIMTVLCDAVQASHGQFYGSWDNLIARYPWSRAWWFKWLKRLEEHGLVANLGRLPGRKTTTFQVLPHLYHLVSTCVDISDEDEARRAVSTDVDYALCLHPWTPLVSTFSASVSTDVDTNIYEHQEHQISTSPNGATASQEHTQRLVGELAESFKAIA